MSMIATPVKPASWWTRSGASRLRGIFGQRHEPARVELIDQVKVLTSNAYHSERDKGSEALWEHIEQVRRQFNVDWRSYAGLTREQFRMGQLITESHEICELKDDSGKLLYPRSWLVAYRDPRSGQPLDPEYIDLTVNIGKRPGQPYLNYIDELLDLNLYVKHSDLTVNTAPERGKLNPEETDEEFKLKKTLVYPGAKKFIRLAIDRRIDRTKTKLIEFMYQDAETRSLVPDIHTLDHPHWYDAAYTPKEAQDVSRRSVLASVGGLVGLAASARAITPKMK